MPISRMKQATLFSLKVWKKAVTEHVVTFKEVLESKTSSEAVVLKTLACLKQKKITKESILSANIGEVLKTLAEGSNLKVAHEARALIKYWDLDVFLNHPAENVSVCKTQAGSYETRSEIEVIAVHTPTDPTTGVESSKETKLFQLCSNDKTCNDTLQVKDKLFDGFHESKEKPFVGISQKELKRRLGNALEQFTQALGEQEVKCYLHDTSP